ncbi:hypothetical protein BO83DRAFT_406610 [Aspergillus eucalypticola CBS 122712]|uniref:Uncharacterized protein n=1 Tax=Aspergillus eucalypticola (strain CBS 122712 / IBT 29274) TaxID=1448314 RepID=A0A317VX74_ASPEC|nr:uncharacterized protein BO83DRAFT_406610 [Aspergillus eucalypticola CBS 122712]PWY78984.1 hypothetical protein BO83DRAFT_406610 [Aspergillus eucalypticola CBS 122712]
MSLDPLPNRNPTPPPTLSLSPIRVLVQTLTHLVPSTNQAGEKNIYDYKLFTMLDTICQHTWKCDFDGHVHRWYTYGDEFGYSHRMCDDDSKVPIECYEWDGSKFIDKPQILQFEDVQAELKSVPFTPAPYKPSEKPPVRDIVRRRLRSARRIPVRELDHMRDHPEDMEWLDRKVKPRFWTNFLEQLRNIEKTREWEEEQRIIRREFEEEEAKQKEIESMGDR